MVICRMAMKETSYVEAEAFARIAWVPEERGKL
jgi:hypothetical protein